MLHATKSDIDVRLCSIHLPPIKHVAWKKSYKKLFFSNKKSIIMTREVLFKALLGVIILESLEEKETNNKKGKTRLLI